MKTEFTLRKVDMVCKKTTNLHLSHLTQRIAFGGNNFAAEYGQLNGGANNIDKKVAY